MHCTYGAWGVCCVSTTLNMWLMLRSLYELTTARSVPLYEIAGVWGYSAMSPDLSRTTTMSGHFSCHYGNAKALEASSLGHTRHTWTRTVEDDVAALNIGLTMAWGRALDWTGWRSIVETAALHWGPACHDDDDEYLVDFNHVTCYTSVFELLFLAAEAVCVKG